MIKNLLYYAVYMIVVLIIGLLNLDTAASVNDLFVLSYGGVEYCGAVDTIKVVTWLILIMPVIMTEAFEITSSLKNSTCALFRYKSYRKYMFAILLPNGLKSAISAFLTVISALSLGLIFNITMNLSVELLMVAMSLAVFTFIGGMLLGIIGALFNGAICVSAFVAIYGLAAIIVSKYGFTHFLPGAYGMYIHIKATYPYVIIFEIIIVALSIIFAKKIVMSVHMRRKT